MDTYLDTYLNNLLCLITDEIDCIFRMKIAK